MFEILHLEGGVSEDAVEGPPRRLSRMRWLTPCLKTAFTKKDKRIIVILKSLLRGMEGPISARPYL